jgi:hypothetical protein
VPAATTSPSATSSSPATTTPPSRCATTTIGAFQGDYVRNHITHGYALTVHSAQGTTADTTHAVLGENATRALTYVAMTRGRECNTAFLYQRTPETEHQPNSAELDHVIDRGTSQHAATLLRATIANAQKPTTAHDIAATTASESLPALVRDTVKHRTLAVRDRNSIFRHWRATTLASDHATHTARGRDIGADRSSGEWLELQ